METIQKEEPSSQRIACSMRGIAEQIIKASKTIEKQPQKVKKMIEILMGARRTAKVFILADGRSGKMGEAFAIRLVHLGFTVYVMLKDTAVPRVTATDVVIVVSGTGTTNTVVAKLQSITKEKIKARIIVITSHPKSPTGRRGNLVIELPGRDEASINEEEPPLSPLGSRFEINALGVLRGYNPGIDENYWNNREANG